MKIPEVKGCEQSLPPWLVLLCLLLLFSSKTAWTTTLMPFWIVFFSFMKELGNDDRLASSIKVWLLVQELFSFLLIVVYFSDLSHSVFVQQGWLLWGRIFSLIQAQHTSPPCCMSQTLQIWREVYRHPVWWPPHQACWAHTTVSNNCVYLHVIKYVMLDVQCKKWRAPVAQFLITFSNVSKVI